MLVGMVADRIKSIIGTRTSLLKGSQQAAAHGVVVILCHRRPPPIQPSVGIALTPCTSGTRGQGQAADLVHCAALTQLAASENLKEGEI